MENPKLLSYCTLFVSRYFPQRSVFKSFNFTSFPRNENPKAVITTRNDCFRFEVFKAIKIYFGIWVMKTYRLVGGTSAAKKYTASFLLVS